MLLHLFLKFTFNIYLFITLYEWMFAWMYVCESFACLVPNESQKIPMK